MIKHNSKKYITLILTSAVAFCLALGCVGGAPAAGATATPVGGNYYFTDFDTGPEAYNAGNELNKEIMAEGITLLKNENSLPLKENAKVSVFGKRSVNLLYGGAGSGAGSGGQTLSVQDSLTGAGIRVNPDLTDFYHDNTKSGNGGKGLQTYGVYAGPNGGIGETPVSDIKKYVDEKTYAAYNDAAIVVISRASAEAGDAPKGMSTGYGSNGNLNGIAVDGARTYDDHYLQPDANEAALIQYVGGLFDNVILVINSGSQIEAGFLDDPGHYAYHKNVKGALWIGYPGVGDGFEAFGEIIAGKINPCGHTTDTYARDFKADPTWSNMPIYTNNLFNYTNLNKSFVQYDEGIYSGYRYYETLGYTEGDAAYTGTVRGTSTTEWENRYRANVVYPFGHGLSYTTFDWEFAGDAPDGKTVLGADDTISLPVKVTNTGEKAGKDVVQLYYTAPYFDGEIEKPHVVLGAYEKTKLLDPGESEILTLTLAVRDMASYDYNDANKNTFRGYESDGGEYVIRLAKNAHDTVLRRVFEIPENGYKYETAKNTNYKVENRFDDVSEGVKNTLTRSDWNVNRPQEPTADDRTASQEVIDLVNNTSDNNRIIAYDDPSKPYYRAEMPITGVDSGIKLQDLYGLPIDDPQWNKFIEQFEVGDKTTSGTMANILWNGGWTLYGNDKFGMPKTSHEDGPSGIAGKKVKGNYSNFASETVTAATWNKEIAHKKGLILGSQAMLGNSQVNGLYAPACNIHRSPFGGRNFEYFSEDGYLSGMMAGEIIRGCNEKGLITFLKHFAVNDQESKRDTLLTWASEQSMREIYFRPFQICVEDYQSHGIMTALNNLGAVWTGGRYNLLTEVLRNEWGFDGMIITDYVQGRGQLNGNRALRGGGDFLLATSGSVQTPAGLDKPTTVANMQRALRNVCYTIVNYTAIFNKSNVNALGAFEGGTLEMAIDEIPYEQRLSVEMNNGGSGVRYELKQGSTLPQGLSLSPDGVISGTAKAQGEAAVFTVVAAYGMARREATFTLPVVDKSNSIIYFQEDKNIAGSYVGREYRQDIAWAYTLDGKEHEITYALAEGSLLPRGLTLSPAGVISGTPQTTVEHYKFTVTASEKTSEHISQENSDGSPAEEPKKALKPMSVTLTLSTYGGELILNGKQLADAEFGASYFDSVSRGGGTAKVSYSLKDGDSLPKGLLLTADGNIIGNPQETVLDKEFTVVASANNFQTVEAAYKISVAVGYDPFVPDNATVGTEYRSFVNYAQGAGDIVYQAVRGNLPEGIALSGDGVLSGTAEQSGNYTFTVRADSQTALCGEIDLTLTVENAASHVMYTVGLIVGIAGLALAAGGCAVYLLRIDKRNYKDGTRAKINKRFLAVAGSVLCCVLTAVIVGGVLLSPVSKANGAQNTFTFEAEYVCLDEFMGAGISNSAEGVNNIYGDGLQRDIDKGWSNGYFLGNTYAKNSVTFEITSDKAATGKLVLRLASELGNMSLNNDVFGVEVNGVSVGYSVTVANSSSGNYDFVDYPIGANINLAEGLNKITLTIKDNTLKDGNSIGAPLIDCIRVTTAAALTWEPLTDNLEKRGQIDLE